MCHHRMFDLGTLRSPLQIYYLISERCTAIIGSITGITFGVRRVYNACAKHTPPGPDLSSPRDPPLPHHFQ
jgi:hypothetical protein